MDLIIFLKFFLINLFYGIYNSISSCLRNVSEVLFGFLSPVASSRNEASPSPSPLLTFPCSYHVFLSFRGKDTRTTFTDHLYTALTQAGIHTFRDDDGIERGEDIKRELEKAIQQSKVAVIVFSPEYASSRWCLDELVQINERRKAGLGHILPIFYHIDPYLVRRQRESFGEAFAEHEKRHKVQPDKLEKWRFALKEVADLSGEVLKDQQEASFIQHIVKLVGRKLDRKLLYVEPYLVGVDSYVNDINEWLEDESTDVRILIVHGIGGVGKTTIAKTVYNKNSDKFEKCCFLKNVRETSEQPNGVQSLQEQILRDMGRSEKIYNTDQGVIKIKEATCCKKVIIIFDDLDDSEQFKKIIGSPECLPSRSKIIMTTRNMSLLNCNECFWKLKIEPLRYHDSFQLFNLHAFRGNIPPRHLFEYSRRAVEYCGGLPLALAVLASSLSRFKSIDLWESAIKEMQAIPKCEVQKVLKLSFDSLENDRHQHLFLHIACFFVGMDKDDAVTILDGCGFQTLIGIEHLIDRCLITSECNKLMMHQLVRDMGREIVRRESDEPAERSRVWNHEEAFRVLTERSGTKNIKGLTLDLHMLKENYGFENSLEGSVPPCGSVPIKAEAFKSMCNLMLLQLNNVKLAGSIEKFPKNLVWLCWHGFPLKYIPANSSHIEKLVVLDMSYSSLEHVFQESLSLPRLKILKLSNSGLLTTTSNFMKLPNLERLILKNCRKLVEIDESIGVLQRLVLLNLKGCIKLRKLPRTIGHLKALKRLYLAGCTELRSFADGITLEELSTTSIDDREVNQLSALGLVSKGGAKINRFSFAFLPLSLTELNLRYCNLSDDCFPRDLRLPFLEILDLSGNIFHTLPDEIFKGCTSLLGLDLSLCKNIAVLPEVPNSLCELHLEACQSLTDLPDLSGLNLDGLGITTDYCRKLARMKNVYSFDILTQFDMVTIHRLQLFYPESLLLSKQEMISSPAQVIIVADRLKGLREEGIFSIFQPGSEIPSWFQYQEEGSSISFVLASSQDDIIYGLNICIAYQVPDDLRKIDLLCHGSYVRVASRSKRSTWSYFPSFFGLRTRLRGAEGKLEECNDMLWLSFWNFSNQLKSGDDVNVTVPEHSFFKAKRIGVHPVVRGHIWSDSWSSYDEFRDDKNGIIFECECDSLAKSRRFSLPPVHMPKYENYPWEWIDHKLGWSLGAHVRGKDTRTTFTDHLYTALTQAGIHAFREDDEIERGEDIKRGLEKAIQQSKVAVIVFSPNYASLSLCLDELVLINERRNADLGHKVQPDMRSFGEAFARHEKGYKVQPDKLEEWRSALKEVADLSCEVLKDQDDDEIERGEDIKKELDKAIEQSKVAIVVLSPDYASSRWCLDELVKFNQGRKAGLSDIFPVFYHMEPSEIKWRKRSYDMAFAKHEEHYKEQLDMVRQWKDVLQDVAALSGEILKEDQYEAPFIENIVKIVGNKLDRKLLYVESYLVGIDSYVNDINSWLRDDSTSARILTLNGIGGTGKSTIIKTVYNQN